MTSFSLKLDGASGSCNANINPLDIKVRSLTANVKTFIWDRYPKLETCASLPGLSLQPWMSRSGWGNRGRIETPMAGD